jgi:serine/threonine-protein kinase
VKQVAATQVVNAQGQTRMTVSIGTAGYMPSEQSKGSPKLSSDIYAVGMIAIQALTGKMPPSGLMLPSELQEDPETEEIIWRDQVQVSQGLAEILDKMVRYDFRQRYRDATEVLQAVQLLAKSSTSTPPSGIPGYTPTQPVTSLDTPQHQRKALLTPPSPLPHHLNLYQ